MGEAAEHRAGEEPFLFGGPATNLTAVRPSSSSERGGPVEGTTALKRWTPIPPTVLAGRVALGTAAALAKAL